MHPRRTSITLVVAAIVAVLVALGCAGDDDIEQRCVDARARLANARVDMLGEAPNERLARDYEQHRKNFEQALGDQFLDHCTKQGDRLADCVLSASTPSATLDCTRSAEARQALRADRRSSR